MKYGKTGAITKTSITLTRWTDANFAIDEESRKSVSGYVYLAFALFLTVLMIGGFVLTKGNPLFLVLIPLIIFIARGFFIVNPNSSKVLVLINER